MSEKSAREFAAGPTVSSMIGSTPPPADAAGEASRKEPAFDPLKLCIFSTVALLGWIFGPFALLVFAGVAFAGYWKAHQAGLRRSRCYLRDTRLVLAYLALLTLAGVAGAVWWGMRLFGAA